MGRGHRRIVVALGGNASYPPHIKGTAQEQLDIIEVSTDIARDAGELAQRFGLRGYDAVHLAAGLAMNDTDVVLVTGDHDLAAAAHAAGMAVSLTTR